MIPVEFEQMNFTFGKPADMTDEQCAPLHVYKGKDTEGFPVIISCWQFSKEDLEEIARTGKMYLQISATGMPPLSLYTENPFELPK